MTDPVEAVLRATLLDLYRELKADTDHWWRTVMGADDRQLNRRAAIRATFGFVEGITFGIKQLILAQASHNLFSREELAMLRDEQYELSDRGRARVRSARLRSLDNLTFAFEMFARWAAEPSPLDMKSDRWADLKLATSIRDRLMHPKRREQLDVSDSEVISACRAYNYVHAALVTILTPSGVREEERGTPSDPG